MSFLAGLFLGVIIGFLVGVKAVADGVKKEMEKWKRESNNADPQS